MSFSFCSTCLSFSRRVKKLEQILFQVLLRVLQLWLIFKWSAVQRTFLLPHFLQLALQLSGPGLRSTPTHSPLILHPETFSSLLPTKCPRVDLILYFEISCFIIPLSNYSTFLLSSWLCTSYWPHPLLILDILWNDPRPIPPLHIQDLSCPVFLYSLLHLLDAIILRNWLQCSRYRFSTQCIGCAHPKRSYTTQISDPFLPPIGTKCTSLTISALKMRQLGPAFNCTQRLTKCFACNIWLIRHSFS